VPKWFTAPNLVTQLYSDINVRRPGQGKGHDGLRKEGVSQQKEGEGVAGVDRFSLKWVPQKIGTNRTKIIGANFILINGYVADLDVIWTAEVV